MDIYLRRDVAGAYGASGEDDWVLVASNVACHLAHVSPVVTSTSAEKMKHDKALDDNLYRVTCDYRTDITAQCKLIIGTLSLKVLTARNTQSQNEVLQMECEEMR
jgi:head-tail adaptor